MISYSQNFEDVMLWRALKHVQQGFYIDIGAQDPLIDSVSLAFHEQGWLGIHIEPTPYYASQLREKRPGDVVIQTAIGDATTLLHFYEISGTGISTADPIIAQQHRERGFDVHEIIVPCITLEALFDSCTEQEIHWLKIDVEGFERQVLSSWGAAAARPWIVVVESTLPLTQIETHETWESTLIGYGYSYVYFDGLNRYYVSNQHPELTVAFNSPPNVFDGFALNGTSSTPFHRLVEERHTAEINEIASQNEQQKKIALQEIESLRQSLASVEKAYAEQDHSHDQLKTSLHRQLQSGQQELRRLEQERVKREQILGEQHNHIRDELEHSLRMVVKREQDIAAQLTAIQQNTEQEKTALTSNHQQQQAALLQQFSEREQTLNQQLQIEQNKRDRLEQDWIKREQVASGQTEQVRQKLETQLASQVQREQQVALQLQELQQQAAEKMAQQDNSHYKQVTALQHQHQQQLTQAQKEVENILRTLAQREQQIAGQILSLQQQAVSEQAEQARDHNKQIRSLLDKHAEREATLRQQLQTKQQVVQTLQQERVKREQDVGTQLLALHQQAADEKLKQLRDHNEQARLLQYQHSEQQKELTQQLNIVQSELYRQTQLWTQQENTLNQQIALLQSDKQALDHARQVQAQEHHAELSQRTNDHHRLMQECAALEAQLKAEVQSEQQISLGLRQSLEQVQQRLAATHASLTWRMTAPLRTLANIMMSPRDPDGSAAVSNANLAPHQTTKQESESVSQIIAEAPHIALQAGLTSLLTDAPPIAIETIMPISTQSTDKQHPVAASSVEELLAYHDLQFVSCAYQTILGRAPDAEGLQYYLRRIRAGIAKIQLLKQLRSSPEGKAHQCALPDLDVQIRRFQIGQLPLVGWIYRLALGVEGASPSECKLRGIENQILLLSVESNYRFNQLDAVLASMQNFITNQTQSLPSSMVSQASDEEISLRPILLATHDELKRLSPYARDIYFQLKTAAIFHATKVV